MAQAEQVEFAFNRGGEAECVDVGLGLSLTSSLWAYFGLLRVGAKVGQVRFEGSLWSAEQES